MVHALRIYKKMKESQIYLLKLTTRVNNKLHQAPNNDKSRPKLSLSKKATQKQNHGTTVTLRSPGAGAPAPKAEAFRPATARPPPPRAPPAEAGTPPT